MRRDEIAVSNAWFVAENTAAMPWLRMRRVEIGRAGMTGGPSTIRAVYSKGRKCRSAVQRPHLRHFSAQLRVTLETVSVHRQ
jgi:hypothetical protein